MTVKLSAPSIDRILGTADTLLWMSEAFGANPTVEEIRAKIAMAREAKNEAFEADLLPLIQRWVAANQPFIAEAQALYKKHYA